MNRLVAAIESLLLRLPARNGVECLLSESFVLPDLDDGYEDGEDFEEHDGNSDPALAKSDTIP